MAFSNGQIQSALSSIFGFHTFRPHQEEIVRAILGGGDVFAVMPTGGGKSLCYQLPAHLMDGVCVVVSPLISLMKDQVDAARNNGLTAGALNSASSLSEKNDIGNALRDNDLDLLYISPERFNSEYFIERLKTLKIAFFAIDEAHCISEWGHDFRPDYLALSRIVHEFPETPVAAFTATATQRVAENIVKRLGLRNPHLTRASFNRPNLFYRVIVKQNLDDQLQEFLANHKGESGIIYRTSRKKVEQTAEMLRAAGFSAQPYHAGMSDIDRGNIQEAFRRDECSIIVATIAFGMGIDKSNVRFVIHADLPKNIEGYYQETGRSGRDSDPADCVLYFGRQDAALLARFADDIEDKQQQEIAKEQLWQMVRFAENDGCRRAALLKYFGETFPEPNCNGCDVCAGNVEREDATVSAQKVLSAIYRTKEKFGAVHLTDILVGANTEKIRQFQHETLPTYGVGKDKSKQYWRAVIESLMAQKIITVDDPQRPAPKLTEDAWSILRSKKNFLIMKQQEVRDKSRDKLKTPELAGTKYRRETGAIETFSEPLFQRLRELRTECARAENVPPYIVFSDRSLHEMARYFPRTPEEFRQINGVGERKFENYGQKFLVAINDFCIQNPDEIENLQHQKPPEPDKQISAKILSPLETYRLIQQGKTIEEAAQERVLSRGTIVSHLEQAVAAGCELSADQFFVPERLTQIEQWFKAGGAPETWNLTPMVEASAGQLEYEEARLARIFLRKKLNA